MATDLYQRIKDLCARDGITVAKLESDLSFGNSSIRKWQKTISPSIDKIIKVANYFDVSVDYLLGMSDVTKQVSEFIDDEDIISFQRARERMTPKDRERMMQLLRIGFEEAFKEGDDS